jgi:hypothetical protein
MILSTQKIEMIYYTKYLIIKLSFVNIFVGNALSITYNEIYDMELSLLTSCSEDKIISRLIFFFVRHCQNLRIFSRVNGF